MNTSTPAPLLPDDVDLRGLDYMPLFGNHLFGSDFNSAATDSEWRAGVTLWWAAWNQVPAGSLPADDVALCRLADLGRDLRAWAKVKARALHGFTLCTDGRMYHAFICRQALIAWEKRMRERERKAKWRAGLDSAESRSIGDDGTSPERGPRRGQRRGQNADVPANGNGRDGNEEKKPSASSVTPTIPCPYQSIVELYHAQLPELPKVKLMSPSRQKAMRTFWGWVLSSTRSDASRRATNAEEALVWIRDYFGRASVNDFLMGRGQRSGSHANWRCDIDFLLTERGRTHVIEKTQEAAA